ncbi:unnamed protein product [Onchocerca ochengi]|uniref:Hyaluronan/mRNA-binding protein domain-containing protein n=1 Tax=Onchocerca ochengi TaxID=42157 RepID=A0A182E778_ONCOC|nr:unnamed protein product [Onchocerca ochengi]
MSSEFSTRGGGIHKNFNSHRGDSMSRGRNRSKFSTRGARRGGISPKRGGNHSDLFSRGRGFGKGSNRGGRGNWSDRGGRGSRGDRGRGGHGRSDQGRKGFLANNGDGLGFKKRMSFDIDNRINKEQKSGDGKKNENKYKKSMSEPSTPATVKFRKYEMDSEHDEDEEMSISDIQDEEITTKTSEKIAADITSKQRKALSPKNSSNFTQIISAKGLPKMKGALKREKDKKGDKGKKSFNCIPYKSHRLLRECI